MSFGIYLYRFDVNDLAEADRSAVRTALVRWGWDGSSGSPYQIGTSDGITAEFYASWMTTNRSWAVSFDVQGFRCAFGLLHPWLPSLGPSGAKNLPLTPPSANPWVPSRRSCSCRG